MKRYKSIYKENEFITVIDLIPGKKYKMISPEGFGSIITVVKVKKKSGNKCDLYYLDSKGNERSWVDLDTWSGSGYGMFTKI